MCESFNLKQHVSHLTHEQGHTLDLVFTVALSGNSFTLKDFVSDHKTVLFDIALQIAAPSLKCTVHSRISNERSADNFSSVFSAQCSSLTQFHDVSDLVDQFNVLCSSVMDYIAPRARSRHQSNPSLWVSEDTQQLKRDFRSAE